MQIKQIAIAVLSVFIWGLNLTSCRVSSDNLYSWHKYEATVYSYIRSQSPERLADLVDQYERLIDRQREARKMPPPGVCAEYGYLLLKTGKRAEGLEMLKREIGYYPESEVFIARIIKQFS